MDNVHKTPAVVYGTAESEMARLGCCGVDWVQIPCQIGDTAPILKGQIPDDYDEARSKRQTMGGRIMDG